ncbi:MAG: HesA/MoeB/ThiF family protein [Deltaproteobacteria bacterium]|nr:HesA/MoeB/ThiF family protein [Deltaproteobacteria bacterium]
MRKSHLAAPRYERQNLLPEFGDRGQARLSGSRVLVVGAGGLGSPVLLYLVAAGIGRITFMDPDVVDESNLHRQILHLTPDIGRPKVDSALEKLSRLNPLVAIDARNDRFSVENAMHILSEGYDIIVDATDGFENKFLVNDAAVLSNTPLVCGGVLGWEGQVMSVLPARSACYRCLFGSPPAPGSVPTPAQAGLIGTAPAVVGSLQATEVIKLLLKKGRLLLDRLMVMDLLVGEIRTIEVHRDTSCPVCGEAPKITSLVKENYNH